MILIARLGWGRANVGISCALRMYKRVLLAPNAAGRLVCESCFGCLFPLQHQQGAEKCMLFDGLLGLCSCTLLSGAVFACDCLAG
jgi:hypothetical protein